VAGQTFALQVLVALLVVGIGMGAAYVQAQRAGTQEATARATAVAETVASTPDVATAVAQGDPRHELQQFAEDVRAQTRTDFVVIMSPRGIRYTHPDPAQIGGQFLGHIAAAVAGGRVVEDYTGTLGPSRRVVVPVLAADDRTVVGLVAVGIRKAAVSVRLRSQLPALLLAGLAAAVLSGIGTALVARRIRRQTHGLGERQLQEMVEYYDAVLHAVTEGLLLTDPEGRLRLANDEAVRLLGLPDDARGRPVADLGLADALVAALTDDEPREDELHVTAARVLVLNKARAQWGGRQLGFVATVRDRTDLEHLTGELDSARGLTEALRSQAHESANRLHAIVSLIELGHPERAMAFATDELALSQRLTDRFVGSVSEPALTALLLGKAAQASERGIDFRIVEGAVWPSGSTPVRDVVTIVGNLIDNAFDAVTSADGERVVEVASGLEDDQVVLRVSDSGPGLPPDAVDDAFRRGFTTKQQGSAGRRGIGLALVAQSVSRLHGELEVAGPPGASFTVRLPLTPVEGVGGPAAAPDPTPSPGTAPGSAPDPTPDPTPSPGTAAEEPSRA
jgi:sensor histidine kinase regulating citrate/malate metabolism